MKSLKKYLNTLLNRVVTVERMVIDSDRNKGITMDPCMSQYLNPFTDTAVIC